jgi:hypothetical protein
LQAYVNVTTTKTGKNAGTHVVIGVGDEAIATRRFTKNNVGHAPQTVGV